MQTQARIPLKACVTAGTSWKWERQAAMVEMITSPGETTPSVARMPPRMPRCLAPTKVEVFTAMMPGVHCPMAK